MSKAETAPANIAPPAPAPAEFPLSLDEFCARLSTKDRRVALIAGFHAHARERGMTTAREADFRNAWDAYRVLPG